MKLYNINKDQGRVHSIAREIRMYSCGPTV